EVLPPGTTVAAGDVLARCDARAIDEQLADARLELGTQRLNHEATLERNRLEARAAESARARAQAGLERARRALESWKTNELAFSARQDELSKRYQEANLEDQTDELDQLEKMYAADELVDATEDIVLKRSRRGLALTKEQNALALDRARVRRELDQALERERREEEVRTQTEALERLEREQELAARARADAELRSGEALAKKTEALARLERDRALFELRAPEAGVLLHGARRDWRPGKSPARLERGATLATRAEVFLVVPPEPGGVTFEVTDGERARFADGSEFVVRPLHGPGEARARVALDPLPRALGTGDLTLEAVATLAAPLAGARYGQRVRLEPAGAKE
ncbi:MAG TPA: hypothetical protein VF530_09970, partial [Planctomycetota bacterium]